MPPSGLVTEEIVARLRPWIPTLQKLKPPAYAVNDASNTDRVGPRVVWVGGDVMLGVTAQASFTAVCEALSLLTLLAHIDVDEWKRVVLAVWPSDELLEEWLDTMLPPQFVVGLSVTATSQNAHRLDRFTFNFHAGYSPSRRMYASVYGYLKAALVGGHVLSTSSDAVSTIRVRTKLESNAMERATPSKFERLLQWLVDVVSTEAWENRGLLAQGAAEKLPHFKITNVDFTPTVGIRLDLNELLHLQQLALLGVRINHLPAFVMRHTPPVGFALRDIGCLDDCSHVNKYGVRAITIEDETASEFIPALLTMAQHSPFIQCVDVNVATGAFMRENEKWRWIAYSLFSRHADHAIDSLVLNLADFQDEQVAAVREVLESSSPFAVSMGVEVGRFLRTTPRQIVASRFVLESNDRVHRRRLPFETKRPIAVRVVEPPLPGYYSRWAVQVPGFGNAFVYDEDVLSTSMEDLPLVNRTISTPPGFQTIAITSMSDTSMHSVVDLLELIGHETERVDVGEHSGHSDVGEWCGKLLAVCPQLQELQIRHASVENLGVFVEAARAGRSRLHTLRLGRVPTERRAENLRVLLDALSDSHHPITEHLQHLELNLFVTTEDPRDVADPVLRMLDQNRRLLSFSLNFTPVDPVETPVSAFRSALDTLTDKFVFIRTGPVGIQQKLSFLSVVDHARDRFERAVGQLDIIMLELVFQFAAEGRVRKVRFS